MKPFSLWIVLVLLALVSCDFPETDTDLDYEDEETPSYTYVAEYVVSGSGEVDIYLTNETGGSNSIDDFMLSAGNQYRYSLSYFDDNFLYVSAQLGPDGGTVTTEVYYRGRKRDAATSNGKYSIATASYLIN